MKTQTWIVAAALALAGIALATPSVSAHNNGNDCYSLSPTGCGDCDDPSHQGTHYLGIEDVAGVPWCSSLLDLGDG